MNLHELERYARKDIYDRIHLAKYGHLPRVHTDSMYFCASPSEKRLIRKIADRSIRLYDKRYNDLIGSSLFISIFTSLILPLLMNMLKNSIASGINESIKKKIVDPILDRLIGYGKSLVGGHDRDEAYTDTIIRNVKSDMSSLVNILNRERSSIAGKVSGLFSKIKNVT